jgi:hypothetical protein
MAGRWHGKGTAFARRGYLVEFPRSPRGYAHEVGGVWDPPPTTYLYTHRRKFG